MEHLRKYLMGLFIPDFAKFAQAEGRGRLLKSKKRFQNGCRGNPNFVSRKIVHSKIRDYLANPTKSSSDFVEQPLRGKFCHCKIWVYKKPIIDLGKWKRPGMIQVEDLAQAKSKIRELAACIRAAQQTGQA